MNLTPVMEKFILHWGEMGTRWGVNRTVAQIHALLYIAGRPLHAEQITDTLGVARSNVSTSIRELQNWGIVHLVHVRGDRRDHFESLTDVWQMFRLIMDVRKKREIDPTLTVLRQCVTEALHTDGIEDQNTQQRLKQLLDFSENMSTWYIHIRALPQAMMVKFVKMGAKISQILDLAP